MRIDLKNQFSASSASWQNFLLFVYCNYFFYFRLPVFEHLGYSGMFGTKSNATARINTKSGIDIPIFGYKRTSNAAATGKPTQFPTLANLVRFFVKHLKIIHMSYFINSSIETPRPFAFIATI